IVHPSLKTRHALALAPPFGVSFRAMKRADEQIESHVRLTMLAWLLRGCAAVSFLALLGLIWFLLARLFPDVPQPTGWARALVLVLVSGAVGYVTNYLAIKMLFRPHRRRNWLVVWRHGLLPREQQRFARALGRVSADRLLSAQAVSEALNDERLRGPLGKALREEIDLLLASPATRELLVGYVTEGVRLHGPAFVRRMRPELRAAI